MSIMPAISREQAEMWDPCMAAMPKPAQLYNIIHL